jgi:hypothetical protein
MAAANPKTAGPEDQLVVRLDPPFPRSLRISWYGWSRLAAAACEEGLHPVDQPGSRGANSKANRKLKMDGFMRPYLSVHTSRTRMATAT